MSYSTILMGAQHKEAVLRLWREALYDPRVAAVVAERFPWFYEHNPSGPPATWLGVLEPEREIVGCGSLYPRTTYVEGRALHAGVLSDFAVDKAHRLGGCAVAIQRALVRHGRDSGYAFVYGYPNKGSLPVVKRVGYEVLGEAVPYSKPLQTADLLAGRMPDPRLSRALADPRVAAMAGSMLDVSFAALDLGRMASKLIDYRVEVLARADARFDALWAQRVDTRIMGEKTVAYLNWRYASYHTTDYRFFCLVERRSLRLAGYLVYAVDDNKAFIADLYTPRCDETVDHLLLHFAMRMRWERRALIYLAYFGDPAFGRRLEALHFFRRPSDRQVILLPGKDLPAPTAALLRDPSRWFMLDGELDV